MFVLQAKCYQEQVLDTRRASSVSCVTDLPEGAVYVTEYKTFPADAVEVEDYHAKLAECLDKRRCGERTEFNKLSIAQKVKAAQPVLKPAITNAHISNDTRTGWLKNLNRNPLDLKRQSYRSTWTIVNNRCFAAILRTVSLEAIQMPFVYHKFTDDCKQVQTVLVTPRNKKPAARRL